MVYRVYKPMNWEGEDMPKSTMDELRDIRWLKLQTEQERERAVRLREQIGTATSKIRESPSRGTAMPDIMAEQLAKLIDIEADVLEHVVEAEERIANVARRVDELPGAQRVVLRMRYFEGRSWREVARATHYTERRCMQIHEDGVGRLG